MRFNHWRHSKNIGKCLVVSAVMLASSAVALMAGKPKCEISALDAVHLTVMRQG